MKKNVIVSYHSWSEVAAEEFAGFLRNERKLTSNEIRMYAARIEHFIRQGKIKVVESEMPAVWMMFKYIVAFPLGSC